MSFLDDETGVETGEPRELFEISHGSTRYLATSGQRDIAYGGDLYIAQGVARLDIVVNVLTADVDFAMVLPVTHPLVKRWFAQLSPPNRVNVVVRRLQLRSGEVESIWSGFVTALSLDQKTNEARFRIPSRSQQSMQRKIPSILVSSTCPHILYDKACKADRVSNTYAAQVVSVDGRDVNITFTVSVPSDHTFAKFGELVHVNSNESQTIWDQTAAGLSIRMGAPIAEIRRGDIVNIIAGCSHDVLTCKNKFNNVINYGGLPGRPTRDPFLPTGFGVVEQF